MFQFAWILVPEPAKMHKMYPYSDQLVTVQVYVDYFLRDISYLILTYLMVKFIPGMSDRLSIFFWLWLGYVIEYLLIYNEPFSYLGKIPLSYSLFAGLLMIGITLNDILKNDTP